MIEPESGADGCSGMPAPNSIAGIVEIRNGLLAAARKEAAQILNIAREDGETIRAEAIQSAQDESDTIESLRRTRLNILKNEFLQQSVGEIISLVEAVVSTVTGDLYSEPAIPVKIAQALRRRISSTIATYLRGRQIQLILNPDDLSDLTDLSGPTERSEPVLSDSVLSDSAVLSDPTVGRGDGRILTEFGTVELKLGDQIAAAITEIRRSDQIRNALIEFLESEDA